MRFFNVVNPKDKGSNNAGKGVESWVDMQNYFRQRKRNIILEKIMQSPVEIGKYPWQHSC